MKANRYSRDKLLEIIAELESKVMEYEKVFNSSHDGIYVTDSAGKTLFVNEALKRISNLTPQNLIGKNMSDLVKEGIFDTSVSMQVIKEKKKVTIFQRSQSGQLSLSTGSPVFDEDGNISMIVTNVRSINEITELVNEVELSRSLRSQKSSELAALRLKQMQEEDLVTCDDKMLAIVDSALKVAHTDATIMLLGETGVGKEVLAQLINRYTSKVNNKPFVKINCGAIPKSLLESELFGYEAGSFTGANKLGKPGIFEMANDGTLFLDEIAEIPLDLQAKLLRVIQEKEIMRVGGLKAKKVNVRIITATNRDLNKMVKEGKFRKDLYYRINVLPIIIPPLRERKADIPLLIIHFTAKLNEKHKLQKKFSQPAIENLTTYSWPGNIRELRNVIENLLLTVEESIITPSHLPHHILFYEPFDDESEEGISLAKALEELEKKYILKAFDIYRNTYESAKSLGISQPTMSRKLKKYSSLNRQPGA